MVKRLYIEFAYTTLHETKPADFTDPYDSPDLTYAGQYATDKYTFTTGTFVGGDNSDYIEKAIVGVSFDRPDDYPDGRINIAVDGYQAPLARNYEGAKYWTIMVADDFVIPPEDLIGNDVGVGDPGDGGPNDPPPDEQIPDNIRDAITDQLFETSVNYLDSAVNRRLGYDFAFDTILDTVDAYETIRDFAYDQLDLLQRAMDGDISIEQLDASSAHLNDQFSLDMLTIAGLQPVIDPVMFSVLAAQLPVSVRDMDFAPGEAINDVQPTGSVFIPPSPYKLIAPATVEIALTTPNGIVLGTGARTVPYSVAGGALGERIEGSSGNDVLSGGGGEDRILAGHGNDDVFGGERNDTLNGGYGDDTIKGGTGNDLMYGEQGDDIIWTGDGDDRVETGHGIDVVFAGPGRNIIHGDVSVVNGGVVDPARQSHDTVIFDGSRSEYDIIPDPIRFVPEGTRYVVRRGEGTDDVTTIEDIDEIRFDDGIFDPADVAMGKTVILEDFQLVHDTFEAGGDGFARATITNLSSNGNEDYYIALGGLARDFYVPGQAQALDVIELELRAYETRTIEWTFTAPESIQRYWLRATLSDPATYTWFQSELLPFSVVADLPFYDLRGGTGGDDTFHGTALKEIFGGGAGDDTYHIGSVDDVVEEKADEGSDIVFSRISYDVPDNIELFILTGDADIDTTGTAMRDYIYGNGGANVIDGGGDFDVMIGGAGNDTYAVDNSYDAIIEASGGGFDNVYSSVDYIIDSGQEIESAILTCTATVLRGDDSDNQLFGNDQVNVIDGRGGTDFMLGQGGADIFQINLEPGAVDVVGDFSKAEGDRMAFTGFDQATTLVNQASATSFEVRDTKGTDTLADDTVQTFQLWDSYDPANPQYTQGALVFGVDYYFG